MPAFNVKPMLILFLFEVYRPSGEFLTHMETSPMLILKVLLFCDVAFSLFRLRATFSAGVFLIQVLILVN